MICLLSLEGAIAVHHSLRCLDQLVCEGRLGDLLSSLSCGPLCLVDRTARLTAERRRPLILLVVELVRDREVKVLLTALAVDGNRYELSASLLGIAAG